MALEIFKLVGSVFVDTNEAQSSLQKLDSTGEATGTKLSSVFSGIGTAVAGIATAAAAATTAVGAVVADTVSEYADYQQAIGGVETLFGDSADKVVENAKNAYMTAGVDATTYMETVTSFSASLLQSLDNDTEKAAEYADMALTDMSDNANKFGTDISSIQNAYTGFAKGNYTMLDNLKLGYGGTKEEMERLLADAQELSGVEYNIDNLSDVYDAIHVIQTEMGVTGTTEKEATTTISGSISLLKNKFTDLKTTLGEKFAPTVQKLVSYVIEKLPDIEALFDKLAPVIVDMVEQLGPVILDLADELLPVIVDLMNELLPVFSQIMMDILPVFVSLIKQLTPFISTLVESLLPPLVRIFDAISPFLTKLIEVLMPPLCEMLNVVLQLLDPLLDLLSPVFTLVSNLIEPIANLVQKLLGPLADLVGKIVELISGDGEGEGLSGALGTVSEILNTVFGEAIDYISEKLEWVMELFGDVITFITDVFKGDWEAVWNDIGSFFTDLWDGIVETFKSAVGWIEDIWDGIVSFFSGDDETPEVDMSTSGYSVRAKGGVLRKGEIGILEGTGAEAVVPLDQNKKWISKVAADMNGALGGSETYSMLQGIQESIAALSKSGIYLDGKKLVGYLGEDIYDETEERGVRKARGIA